MKNKISRTNEINLVCNIVAFLLKKNVINPQQIGIITFYLAQVNELERKLQQRFGKNRPKANTVDSYQVDENEIIIISFVRTTKIGFLNDYRRLNVALTRAKQTLIMLGDSKTLSEANNSDVAALVTNAQERNLHFKNKDIQNFFPTQQPAKNKEKTKKKICQFFNTKQGCYKGDKCKFLHINNKPYS